MILKLKNNFQQHKIPYPLATSKKDFKYFIGCKDDRKAKLLRVMLPKMNAERRDFDETKSLF